MFIKCYVHVVRLTQELVYRRYPTLICQPDFSSERMGVFWEVERHDWLRPSSDCIIARKWGWTRRKVGYPPLPTHNPYSLLSYWREEVKQQYLYQLRVRMGGRKWQRWSCFQVAAKKKGRVTSPQPAVCGTGQEGRWERRKQAICLPSTQKSSRYTREFKVGILKWDATPEAVKAGTCWPRTWTSLGLFLILAPVLWDSLALTAVSAEPHNSSMLVVTMIASSQTTSEIFLHFLTQIKASFCERPVYFCFVILLVTFLVCDRRSCSQSH